MDEMNIEILMEDMRVNEVQGFGSATFILLEDNVYLLWVGE